MHVKLGRRVVGQSSFAEGEELPNGFRLILRRYPRFQNELLSKSYERRDRSCSRLVSRYVTFSIELASYDPEICTETRRPRFAKDAEKGGEQSGLRQSGKRECSARSAVGRRIGAAWIISIIRGLAPVAATSKGWSFFPSSFRKSPFDFVNPVFTWSLPLSK